MKDSNKDVEGVGHGLPSLPKGWSWVSLGELASSEPNAITDGPFGSNLKTEHYTNEGPRVIRLQNIGDGHFRDARAHISAAHFDKLGKHRILEGDLAIAALGESLPRACIIPAWVGPAIVKADCIRFKPNRDAIMPEYLNYALNFEHTRRRTSAIIHGVGRPRLNLKEIRGIPVPLAPPKEQRRIVEKIEELFTDLDAGAESLMRVRAKLKRYRASVLREAVVGRLTAGWRADHPDVEPATELLRHILDERRCRWEDGQLARFTGVGKEPPNNWKGKYTSPEGPDISSLAPLPPGWCWARIDQVGDVQLGRQRSPQHHHGPHMRLYLRVANVFEDRIDTSDVLEMNFTPQEFEVYQLRHGDILLNEGQSLELVGRPALYRDEVPGACFQNTLVRFRAYEGVLPEYALYVFLAYLHNKRFQKIARWTVNIAHLGAERFSKLEFPLPPLDEQKAIVQEIEERLSVVHKVIEQVAADEKRATRLRQAVLKRAFEGRLVPQDPDDEPAENILLRLRSATGHGRSLRTARGSPTKNVTKKQRPLFPDSEEA